MEPVRFVESPVVDAVRGRRYPAGRESSQEPNTPNHARVRYTMRTVPFSA